MSKLYFGPESVDNRPWVRMLSRLLVVHTEMFTSIARDNANPTTVGVKTAGIAITSIGGDWARYGVQFEGFKVKDCFKGDIFADDPQETIDKRAAFTRRLETPDLETIAKHIQTLLPVVKDKEKKS